jgi:hypothetical protein
LATHDVHDAGQSPSKNHVRSDGSFPPKRSPGAGDGCAADHFQPRLLLVAELDQIADAGAGALASAPGRYCCKKILDVRESNIDSRSTHDTQG